MDITAAYITLTLLFGIIIGSAYFVAQTKRLSYATKGTILGGLFGLYAAAFSAFTLVSGLALGKSWWMILGMWVPSASMYASGGLTPWVPSAAMLAMGFSFYVLFFVLGLLFQVAVCAAIGFVAAKITRPR